MTGKGFIFNHEKCVGCGSCGASCVLENGWNVRPRSIYATNTDFSLPSAVINLSLACNHCADPLCLKSCPANAYFKDEDTGAILIDDNKCLGCRYCQWNCPFDAPKFDPESRVIGKCSLCYSSLKEGIEPACSRACPTGALHYEEINNNDEAKWPEWFPESGIKPSLQLTGSINPVPLIIIPEPDYRNVKKNEADDKLSPEWSLILFSFLVTVAASDICASLIKGQFSQPLLIIPVLAAAGIASLFHLGKPLRAWRSVMNLGKSPLSREIILFLLFSGLTVSALFTKIPSLIVASSVSGLITLVAIDNVYILKTSRNRKILLHSGQTLLSGLLIISYLSLSLIPFIFIAVIKLSFLVTNPDLTKNLTILRFIRIAVLLIVIAGWGSGFGKPDLVMILMMLSGELIDRFLFYVDFEPENIRNNINNFK